MHRILNIIASTIVFALLAAAGFGLWVLNQSRELARNSDAVCMVAEMVVQHLKTNNDRWPTGWNDLKDDYEICVKRFEQPQPFDELRERVCINWSATSETLMKLASESTKPALKVIWLSDGGNVHWRGAEPNQYIYNHFTARLAHKAIEKAQSES